MLKIIQNRHGYHSSIDSFLLASFLEVNKSDQIIDLGTGNGIVALLLAAIYPETRLVGLEIQSKLVILARENVEANGFKDRIEILLGDIKNCSTLFEAESVDLVISNPPYRKVRSGRLNPILEKAMSRHELAVNLEQLTQSANYLLKPKGRLALIYHPSRFSELVVRLESTGMASRRIRFIHSYKGSVAKMVLLEASKGSKSDLLIERPLIIYEEKGRYSEEVKNIYARWGFLPCGKTEAGTR